MKKSIFCLMAAGLLAGCAGPRDMGGTVDEQSDKNVLTGGPTSGTTLSELPALVRNALREKVPHAEVADIDKTTKEGRVVYEISFDNQGKNPKMQFSENGQVLVDPDEIK